MLANNVANAATLGYKMDRESYSLYASAEALAPAEAGVSPDPDLLPNIEKHWTDFGQGTLRQTGNPLDVAIEGTGFFAVNGPSGPLYTRNGNFRLNGAGVLTTQDGYPLSAVGGGTLQGTSGEPWQIEADGTVK